MPGPLKLSVNCPRVKRKNSFSRSDLAETAQSMFTNSQPQLGTGELGRVMLLGEYESMKALHNVSPDFAPHPLGHGTYESDPDMHFFICDFIEMANQLPDKTKFCSALADLHRKSTEQSNGKFGFHIDTYNAKLPQDNRWNISWEAFYLRGMQQLFELEEAAQGPSEELKELLPAFYEKVIPRLLRPLETGGNELKPCLIHGDLWDSNVAVKASTGTPLIFDASSFWAHNECELGMWRPERFKIRDDYVQEYFRHYPKSPPEEDWEDRNLLYSLRPDIQDSALFPSSPRFRELILETLRYFVKKYPNGYEGTEKRKDLA
jgi:protein-ribulosamine 3-kinase